MPVGLSAEIYRDANALCFPSVDDRMGALGEVGARSYGGARPRRMHFVFMSGRATCEWCMRWQFHHDARDTDRAFCTLALCSPFAHVHLFYIHNVIYIYACPYVWCLSDNYEWTHVMRALGTLGLDIRSICVSFIEYCVWFSASTQCALTLSLKRECIRPDVWQNDCNLAPLYATPHHSKWQTGRRANECELDRGGAMGFHWLWGIRLLVQI